MALAMMVTEEW